ncbi:MAG: hypothetical protein ACREIA_14395 [Opitutaceae bacterium]
MSLHLETGDDAPAFHPEADDLEGDPAAHGLFLLGKIDRAATALADFLQQFVAIDARADRLAPAVAHERRTAARPAVGDIGRSDHRGGFEKEILRLVLRGEQILDARTQFRIVATGEIEKRAPFDRVIELPGLVEKTLLARSRGVFHHREVTSVWTWPAAGAAGSLPSSGQGYEGSKQVGGAEHQACARMLWKSQAFA